ERLDAGAVPREEQPFTGRVPDGKGEHAAQVPDDVIPILLVAVDDGLGVAARGEAVALRFQVRAKLMVVVDLAIEDDVDRPVLVGDRLLAPGNVDDAES